jgi:hypothetical protein
MEWNMFDEMDEIREISISTVYTLLLTLLFCW